MHKTSLLPSFEATPLHGVDLTAQSRFIEIATELEVIKDLTNPDKCKAEYLPFLAFAYNVDFWDESLSEKEKRNLIKASFLLHQKKGTIWAIEKVFEALNLQASVEEWFEYNGEPYHFKVNIESIGIAYTENDLKRLEKYVNYYKNVRSVIDEISVTASIDGANIYLGSSSASFEFIEMELIA